jgi:restriction system protein
MPLPVLYDLTLPLLRLTAQGDVRLADALPSIADEFGLLPDDRGELLASGRETKFGSRLRWAKVRLVQSHG